MLFGNILTSDSKKPWQTAELYALLLFSQVIFESDVSMYKIHMQCTYLLFSQPFQQNICTLICKRGVLCNVCMKRLTRLRLFHKVVVGGWQPTVALNGVMKLFLDDLSKIQLTILLIFSLIFVQSKFRYFIINSLKVKVLLQRVVHPVVQPHYLLSIERGCKL